MWYPLEPALLNSLQELLPTCLNINNKGIVVVKKDENIFAFSNNCPHAGGKLSEGYIDAAGYIVCPIHQYKFDIRNGYNKSGEGYKLNVYKTRKTSTGFDIFVPLH